MNKRDKREMGVRDIGRGKLGETVGMMSGKAHVAFSYLG
jgi:hypothetical protein